MRELKTGKRDLGCLQRLHPQHCRTPPLDGAVVLLDDVVEIAVAAYRYGSPSAILSTQLSQR
jgi:hypothetical protein